jgi:hypothetical protein
MADSRPTTQQITTLIEQLSKFFPERCATYIRKFVVNSKEVMLRLPKKDWTRNTRSMATVGQPNSGLKGFGFKRTIMPGENP